MSNESPAFAKYKAIARIGSGGMADIYLTEVSGPSGFRKLAVVKRLRPEDAEDEDMVRMFLDEARLAARLNHPNIVNTFEVDSDTNGHFIAMEYLEGQPLDRILRRSTAKTDFPLPLRLFVLCQMLGALQYAHEVRDYDQTELGFVHRDVSPHNVFVLYSGQSKLVDFGIAKSANALGRTRAGAIKGKFAYMAPEQARSEPVDARTDLFAVGMMLWEALAQRRVWVGMNEGQILHALLSGNPLPRPSEFAPDVPPLLEDICMRAVSLRPEDRYASAGEFQIALEDAMNQLGMRVSTRDIGRAVEQAFSADRARLRDQVEAFIRRPSPAESLPVLAVDTTADVGLRLTTGSFSKSRSVTKAPPKRSFAFPIAMGAGLLLFALGATLLVRGRRETGARTDAPATTASEAATSAPAAAAPRASATPSTTSDVRDVRLELSATPATAEIFLDDVPVPNPFRSRRTADGSAHVVRVSGRGYAPQARTIQLEEDVIVDIALSPLPNYVQVPRPRPAPAAAAPRPAPPSSAAPSATSEPPPAAPRPPALDDPLAPPPPKKPRPTLDQSPF